jgi:hypothetical protein
MQERERLIEQRREFRKQAAIDREEILRSFERMKRTGKIDSFDPTSDQSITSSRSAFPLSRENDDSDRARLPKSARRPRSAKPPKSHEFSPGRKRSYRTKGGVEVNEDGKSVAGSEIESTLNQASIMKETRTKKKKNRQKKFNKNKSDDLDHNECETGADSAAQGAASRVDELRRSQNKDLLDILAQEQAAEEKREKLYSQVKDPKEKRQLEKVFGIERAKASARIMKTAEQHEQKLAQLLRKQQRVL